MPVFKFKLGDLVLHKYSMLARARDRSYSPPLVFRVVGVLVDEYASIRPYACHSYDLCLLTESGNMGINHLQNDLIHANYLQICLSWISQKIAAWRWRHIYSRWK